MTFFPVEKPCDKCGRDFLAAIPGQTTCTTCLTAPSRKNIVTPEQTSKPEGEIMPITVEEKICVDCKKPFKPTSNVQKRCPPCSKIHNGEYQKKYRKQEPSVKVSGPSEKKM